MPDDDDYDEAPNEEDSPVVTALRKKAAKADKLEPENTSLRMENAVLKAGLGGLNERQQKALIASHEGDLTPDALKATAAELGFTVETPEPETPQVPDDEQAAHQRVADTTGGAQPAEATVTTLEQKIGQVQSVEELDALISQEMPLQYE